MAEQFPNLNPTQSTTRQGELSIARRVVISTKALRFAIAATNCDVVEAARLLFRLVEMNVRCHDRWCRIAFGVGLNLARAIVPGGMFALGAHTLENEASKNYTGIAKGLTHTCHESYDRTPTKLGPEAFHFTAKSEAVGLKQGEKYYILRPEVFI